jgi:hypothetical protein
MNRSVKEKQYDNKTADYVIGNAATIKPVSIAGDPDKVDDKEYPERIIGKEDPHNPDN